MKTHATLACWLLMAGIAAAKTSPFGDGTPPPVKDPVDNYYLQGNYAQSTGNYDYAISCWDGVLRIHPDDATAFYNRAVAYDSKGDRDKALADLAESMRLNPKDPQAYEFRARLSLEKAGKPPRGEMLDKALADYVTALDLRLQGVDDSKSWLADKADKAENGIQAIACWSAIIKLAPKDPAAWVNRANIWGGRDLDNFDRALADYAEALRLDPNNKDAYSNRATLYLGDYLNGHARDIAKGAADLDALIKLGAGGGTYIYRGAVYAEMGENDKAEADFTEAIRLGLEREGYSERASLYSGAKRWDKAIADYTELIRIIPTAGGLYYQRAWARYRLQDWDGAATDLDKAVEFYSAKHDGSVANALYLRGSAYYHKQEWEKSLADFNRLSAESASNWMGRRGAAWLYATCPNEKFRDGGKAVELAQELCALSRWRNDDEIDILAAAYAESGKWDDAVNYENMALKLATSPGYYKNDKEIALIKTHLALYGQKQPCREEKEPQLYLDTP